jgi:spoIIIJ-associated protein
MRSVESEGESIDQAIDNALQQLQVARERVEVEILADASRGLFGFGGKKARVRATLRAPLSVTFDAEPDIAPVPRATRPTSKPLTVAVPVVEAGAVERTPKSVPEAKEAKRLLEEILALMGVSCTVSVTTGPEPDGTTLEVAGDAGGLLIGRRGQTLDALEYIVNRIAGRDEETRHGRVAVDVERYRERRREYLVALAHRLADKVKDTGHVATLNPMSPRERRIVHLALQGDEAVSTRSQGEGHFRKVLILPATRAKSRRPRSRDGSPA